MSTEADEMRKLCEEILRRTQMDLSAGDNVATNAELDTLARYVLDRLGEQGKLTPQAAITEMVRESERLGLYETLPLNAAVPQEALADADREFLEGVAEICGGALDAYGEANPATRDQHACVFLTAHEARHLQAALTRLTASPSKAGEPQSTVTIHNFRCPNCAEPLGWRDSDNAVGRTYASGEFKPLQDAKTEEPQGWQPISSAPKDGTRLDIWASLHGTVMGGRRIIGSSWGRYDEDSEAPYGERHWRGCGPGEIATHWMSLPKSPEKAGDE